MIVARGLGLGSGTRIIATAGLGISPGAIRSMIMRAGGGVGRSSGPDAQLSLADYRRRFGSDPGAAVSRRLPAAHQDDEAIALLLFALSA